MLPDSIKAFSEGRSGRVQGVEAALWPWLTGEVILGLEEALKGSGEALGGPAAGTNGDLSGTRRAMVLVLVPEGLSEDGLASEIAAVIGADDAGVVDGHGVEVMVYPAWDVAPYEQLAPSVGCVGMRMAALAQVRQGGTTGLRDYGTTGGSLRSPEEGGEDEAGWDDGKGDVGPLVIVANERAVRTRIHWPVGEDGQPLEVLKLAPGVVVTPAVAVRRLVELGYERVEVVQAVGQFAVRGGLLDVWPGGREGPVRLEWFDDEIERVRPFDPATQRLEDTRSEDLGIRNTLRNLEVVCAPVVEAGLSGAAVARFRERYRERCGESGISNLDDDETYQAVSAGRWPAAGAQMAGLLASEPGVGLLDVLATCGAAVRVVRAVGLDTHDYGDEVAAARVALGDAPRGVGVMTPEEMVVGTKAFSAQLAKQAVLEVREDGVTDLPWRGHRYGTAGLRDDGTTGQRDYGTTELRDDGTTGLRNYGTTGGSLRSPEGGAVGNVHRAAVSAAGDLAKWQTEGWVVTVTALTAPGLAQLVRALEGEGAPGIQPVGTLVEALGRGKGVYSVVAPFLRGWVDPLSKVAVVAEGDVFGRKVRPHKLRKKIDPDSLLAHFSELREGDYAVHEAHGIGKFDKLVTLRVGGTTEPRNYGTTAPGRDEGEGVVQDFIRLLYAGDDRLLVPVENLEVLTRYKGGEAGSVTLDRLGTGGWEAKKDKVKEDLMAMAGELLAIAAAREVVTRPAYPVAGTAYDEFCAGFAYALTDDQAQVMDDVEGDLAGQVPMDRLVVGDVGFGKTEVALRAAFLVAQSGRQVAVVCPTTLLARQHIDIFSRRFAGTPYKVGGLSRLVGAAEAKKVKEGLAKGTVDVVVGTHALLSADVKFKDLGLVVIDEEQRFGVAHKEKLKKLAEGTDVLTLTATPIPRTLQMAVGGVRQLSLITTPPVDRQAVQTHLLRWDNATLKAALVRELGRGGQVYVVAPHVEDLDGLRDAIVQLVPQARVTVAHGQMAEGALEAAMVGFYDGSVDVLVATTIIESGLDVPRANTMIVYRSDRFGLAQLYQLRGRVGRSAKKAYAYFLLPEGQLAGDSAKRLQILSRLEGLGAGFMLASYDMDLRGFGNLLGKQQSGHIREIGFELYAKMLREAVEKRQAVKGVKDVEGGTGAAPVSSDVSLKLGVSYLIPESYIADEAVRLQVYRELSRARDAEELADFEVGLKERFGRYPDEVKMLLAVVGLKNRLKALNVNRVDVGEKGVVVGLEKGVFINPEGLMKLVQSYAGVVTVRPDMSLVFHRRLGVGAARVKGVETIVEELEDAAGIAESDAVA